MKNTIYINLILFIFSSTKIYSQSFADAEFMVRNHYVEPIDVFIFPIGAVVNGRQCGENPTYELKYTCLPCRPSSQALQWDYIVGGRGFGIPVNDRPLIDFDDGDYSSAPQLIGGASYGLWGIEIFKSSNQQLLEYCYLDIRDINYMFYGGDWGNDIMFTFKNDGKLYVNFLGNAIDVDVNDSRFANKTIKTWHQIGRIHPIYGADAFFPNSPNRGLVKTELRTTSGVSWKSWPIDALELSLSGAFRHDNPGEVALNLEIDQQNTNVIAGKNLTFRNAALIVQDGINFTLNNNSTITFDADNGAGATFRTLQTSGTKTLTIGTNAQIIVKNGSNININNTIFSPVSSWYGFDLDNTRYDTVKNCTFSGASTYLDFYSSDNCYAQLKKIIQNNTFNNGSVTITNSFQSFVKDNVFNGSPQSYLLNISNSLSGLCTPSGPGGTPVYSWNIVDNDFIGSVIQLKLNCTAGILLPSYAAGNTFTGPSTGVAIWAKQIRGIFENNIVNYSGYNYVHATQLFESNVDFYNNLTLGSNDNTILLSTPTVIRLAPITNDQNKLVWYGGLNQLYSVNWNNIQFSIGSDLSVNNGYNCFNINSVSANHLSGDLSPCNLTIFPAERNYWNTNPIRNSIRCNGQPLPVDTDPTSSCTTPSLPIVGYEIVDRGDGILDSIPITDNFPTGPGGGGYSQPEFKISLNEDDILFYHSLRKRNVRDYTGAIVSLKTLINNHNLSRHLSPSLDELYLNYQNSDTINNQNITNLLFTVLRTYLEQKIQQYQNNPRFVEKAYSFFLMCLTRLRNYTEAIAGYDNIINNHPDPIVRLQASWDRAATILLMNGGGGGKINSEFRIKKSSKLLDNKPTHQIAKELFVEMKDEKQKSSYHSKQPYSKEQVKQIENRIEKFNPTDYKELDNKISDDIQLLLRIDNKQKTNYTGNIIPKEFKLYQNYPNPFNPVTQIIYDLPEDGVVKLTIYNLLGEEVTSLVDEYMTAGKYIVNFNGSGLSSGLYFYKLEVNDYVETRKMLLIK